MSTITILLVEDDPDINKMLTNLLTSEGYNVRSAFSGTEGLLCLEHAEYDIMLLDLMLPGLSGEELLQKAKVLQTGLIVIALSAKDDTDTKISLLRNGADDYMTKPFDTGELLARIEAALRRISKRSPGQISMLSFRDLTLNTETYEVTLLGTALSLTKHEYLILELLMSNPNKVFTKNNIFESVWNAEFLGEDNAVNVHISNIRQKFARLTEESYIQTVWGIGFKMKI